MELKWTSLVLAAACFHTRAQKLNSWVGSDEAALVSEWGAPDLTAPLGGGGKVLTWTEKYEYPIGTVTKKGECRQSFTISPGGKVVSWSASGCSRF